MRYFLFILALFILFGCTNTPKQNIQNKLNYFGRKEYNFETKDSVYHTVEEFSFVNQNNQLINLDSLKGKITLVNFFFTSCPSICPDMLTELKRFQQKVKGKYNIQILSHTVDPKRDSVSRLKQYIQKNNIDTYNWNFVTGSKQSLYESGVFNYYLATQEDALAEGGFLHSEKFVLIDKNLHIRGYYNGTESKDVDRLINELKLLVNE